MSPFLAVAIVLGTVAGLLFLALMGLVAWGTFIDWRYQRRLRRGGRSH